jgi:hypothetical protein
MNVLPDYSLLEPSVLTFVVIPIVLVVLFTWAVAAAWRRAGRPPGAVRVTALATLAASVVWLNTTWSLAQGGVLTQWDRTPPPFILLVVVIFLLAFAIAFTAVGGRLAEHIPLWALVAVQSFRLPLELAMHRMAERGIMPPQMTYTGRNFDIVTGITAILVAALVWSGRGGKQLVLAWNLLGLALLLNVIIVAIVSTPRFAFFGADRLNVWVAYPPFVWLPAVLVLAALASHLIVFRALAHQR